MGAAARPALHQQEAARAVGVFRIAGPEAGLAEDAACWSPAIPAIGMGAPKSVRSVVHAADGRLTCGKSSVARRMSRAVLRPIDACGC